MRTLSFFSLVFVFLLGASPTGAKAQERSVLRLLPTEGRQLPMEGEVEGTLSASDFTFPDNAYVEAWSITGEPGRTVTIDLVSDDLDPILYVAGPGLSQAYFDDDSGGACNARLEVTFLEAGEFHVVVSSTGGSAAGTFTLRTSMDPPPPLAYGCGQLDPSLLMGMSMEGQLEVGGTATGRLGSGSTTVLEGRPLAAWEISGEAGEAVTVTMTSSDFDSYLFAFGPGMESILTDDDSGGDVNAQLTLRFLDSGRYVVGASALSSGSSGSYTLSVARALGPSELPVAGTIQVPGNASGALGGSDPLLDGRRSQVWSFEGDAGQTVTIDLSSDDFDTYLTLLGPGIVAPIEDDDSGGSFNSRIVATLAESGTFRIVAAALGSDTGAFELSVR